MTHALRVVGALARVCLMVAMQYRSDFLFEGLSGGLRTFGAVAPLLLVLGHTTAIGGWTVDQAALVMAFFLLLGSFHGGLMEPNLGEVGEAVRKGTLDLWLTKPVDAQLLVSARKIDPAYLWDALAAVAVAGWALHRLPAPGAIDVAVAVFLLGCGLVAMYGVWLIAICASFVFVRVDNLRYLLLSVADGGRWPLSVFSGWIRVVFTAVIPVGLVTTFPAEALRGTWGGPMVLTAAAVAVLFAGGSRALWSWSLSTYTSAGS